MMIADKKGFYLFENRTIILVMCAKMLGSQAYVLWYLV